MTDADRIRLETARVVARLQSRPIAQLNEDVADMVRRAAQSVVELTPDPHRPAPALVPVLGPQGLAAQVDLVVSDYLEARTAASADAAVAEILTELRRSLP